MDCKPPTFKGGSDVVACNRWVRKMDQTFRSADFTEAQKVNYVVRMLEGDALEWWDTIDSVITENARRHLTWDIFCEKIKGRYCSAGAMQRVEREFRDLKKGSMTIAKFNATFTEKHHFARHCYPTEDSLIRHYVDCLPYEYRATVRQRTTLTEAMDEALKVEDDMLVCNRTTGMIGEKRKWESNAGFSKKKDKYHKKGESRDKIDYCKKCHSAHKGPCTSATLSCRKCGKPGHKFEDCKSTETICYNCRQMGHISSKCPNPKAEVGGKKDDAPKVKVRAFHMKVEDAKRNDEVILGTFLVNSMHAFVLFDPGANKSFVSYAFSDRFKMNRSPLDSPFIVEVALGESSIVREKYDNCSIEISSHTFPITLIPAPINEFDVIIGMNWLAPNRAQVDCAEKLVRIPLIDGSYAIARGERNADPSLSYR